MPATITIPGRDTVRLGGRAIKKAVRKVRALLNRRHHIEQAQQARIAELEARVLRAETETAAAAVRDRHYAAERDWALAEHEKATAERERVAAEHRQALAAAEERHAATRARVLADRAEAVAQADRRHAAEREQWEAERAATAPALAAAERDHAAERERAEAAHHYAIAAVETRVADAERRATEADQRHAAAAAEAERLVAEAEGRVADAEHRAVSAERRAADADRRAADAERLTNDATHRAADAERRAAESDQRYADAERRAADARRATAEADATRWSVAGELSLLRERFRSAAAGLHSGPRFTDAELIAALEDAGIAIKPGERVTLHVGFGHAATTSLQHAFFSQRDDVSYTGVPYGASGGFFSHLKYTDDHLIDPALMLKLCRDTVYAAPERGGRPIVVSDETIAEPTEVYYHPHILPGRQVAARLKRYFPTGRVVFTLRRQPDYVASMYFNLKRNYAYQAGQPIPPFAEWWDGMMHTQVRGPYLLHLDYAPLVRVYAELFGRENVLVLPLEELKNRGDRAYLGRLCEFLGVPLRDADLDHFRRPRNERMTVVEERVAELLSGRHADAAVRKALENDSLSSLTGVAARASLTLSDEVTDEIRRVVSPGNRWLAETFDLPLGEWGYFV